MEKSNKSLGFTLIELMVTLAIVGILISIGIPSLSNFLKNNTLSTNSSDFVGALNFTRSEAVKRGETVTMCISNANATACNAAGNWQNGWLIFVPSAAGTFAGGTVLQVHHSLTGQGTVLKDNAGLATQISYSGTGSSGGNTFVLHDSRLFTDDCKHVRAIVINNTGRIMSVAGDDSRFPASVAECI